MTVSDDFRTRMRRMMWRLLRHLLDMLWRLPAQDEDGSLILQEAVGLGSEIERLLESEELATKVSLHVRDLFYCVERMGERLRAEGKDASKIMQEVNRLRAENKDLLEIEE